MENSILKLSVEKNNLVQEKVTLLILF